MRAKRVPKERFEAKDRISDLENRFELVMKEGDDYFEIEMAMLNVLCRIKNYQLIKKYPVEEVLIEKTNDVQAALLKEADWWRDIPQDKLITPRQVSNTITDHATKPNSRELKDV